MGKIIRHEFLGSRLVVVLLCLTGFGIPLAFFYWAECLVTVVEEVEEPNEFLARHRARTS